jgi:hypothetical protein
MDLLRILWEHADRRFEDGYTGRRRCPSRMPKCAERRAANHRHRAWGSLQGWRDPNLMVFRRRSRPDGPTGACGTGGPGRADGARGTGGPSHPKSPEAARPGVIEPPGVPRVSAYRLDGRRGHWMSQPPPQHVQPLTWNVPPYPWIGLWARSRNARARVPQGHDAAGEQRRPVLKTNHRRSAAG